MSNQSKKTTAGLSVKEKEKKLIETEPSRADGQTDFLRDYE